MELRILLVGTCVMQNKGFLNVLGGYVVNFDTMDNWFLKVN